MDTRSTASSSTERSRQAEQENGGPASPSAPSPRPTTVPGGPAPLTESPGGPAPAASQTAAAGDPPRPDHDASRRAFFREFGRQAVTTVGQVAGMADVLSRAPTRAAANLLGLGLAAGTPAPARPSAPSAPRVQPPAIRPTPARSPEATYHSPYRLDGEVLRIVDQRALPGRLEELTCRRASDVAFYLRIGACRGGPLMAQLAAYALAMSAAGVHERPASVRVAEAGRVRRSLRTTRPSSRLLLWAIDRMEAVEAPFSGDDDGPAAAEALRAEADAIASEMRLGQAAVARHLAELLPVPDGRPLSVLVHGAPGSLVGGLVGTAITALTNLATDGRALTVRVTEARPFLDGARLAAWELRRAGIAHQVIPDAAVAWLLAHEPVDAVLMGAEWIAADGSVAGLVGSRAIALAASAAGPVPGSRPVPVIVGALAATIDPATSDGSAIPDELRPGRELSAFAPAIQADRLNALNPATDVMPAALVTALVTEHGVLSPVTGDGIADLVARGASAALGAGDGADA